MSTVPATVDRGGVALRYELEVEDVIAQVSKIQRVMTAVMKDGEHFGKIPGTNKPTLLKAGAEKLCLMFRLDPQYESVETYEGKHLTVKTRCVLWHIPTGQRMGSGEGSCSTKESKYAYRKGERTCPACGKPIRKSKYPPKGSPRNEPGGWWCPRDTGCGAEFHHDDAEIASQDVGRVANDDLADVYNTILKMANKRALVAAVLNVTAASDIFTQDIEDLVDNGVIHVPAQAKAAEGAPRQTIDHETGEVVERPPAGAEAAERATLIKAIKDYAGRLKLSDTERAQAAETYLGKGVTPAKADLAALGELLGWLKARAGE